MPWSTPPPTEIRVRPPLVRVLSGWDRRRWAVAVAAAAGYAVLVGLATVIIPNPVFTRDIPVVAWNYPVLVLTSVLVGLLTATYVAPAQGAGSAARRGDRAGVAGGVLTWFAVGCPVCNKVALLALGYTGALTWFAPLQPFLAVAALALTTWALAVRLRGEVACPVPRPAVARG